MAVSLLKRPRGGHFTSKTAAVSEAKPPPATWIRKLGLLEALEVIIFQGGDDGRGYRCTYKMLRGSNLKEGG
jgi:hypothetical protein